MAIALLNSSGVLYAATMPDPGIRIVAYDIQNAPYEVNAGLTVRY
jgi:hypothetical protein